MLASTFDIALHHRRRDQTRTSSKLHGNRRFACSLDRPRVATEGRILVTIGRKVWSSCALSGTSFDNTVASPSSIEMRALLRRGNRHEETSIADFAEIRPATTPILRGLALLERRWSRYR